MCVCVCVCVCCTALLQLFQLVEKDFQSKLDMLFRKHLYDVAQILANNQHYDSPSEKTENLMQIYAQWAGSFLLSSPSPTSRRILVIPHCLRS